MDMPDNGAAVDLGEYRRNKNAQTVACDSCGYPLRLTSSRVHMPENYTGPALYMADYTTVVSCIPGYEGTLYYHSECPGQPDPDPDDFTIGAA